MSVERLYRKDVRLIVVCAVVAAVSLYVGVKYFFQAFPESSIDFRTTRESSEPIAREFLSRVGLDSSDYRHAAIFDFDDEAKIFLEREVGVEASARLLESTIRIWRWEHRYFRSLQKEELEVEITTKGEPVGFLHLLDEKAPGADLPPEAAQRRAEEFLTSTMQRPLDSLVFIEGRSQKRPHRTDHTFTWKLVGSDVKGADYRIEVGLAGDQVSGYKEYLKIPDTWKRDYEKLRSWNMAASAIDAIFLVLTVVAMLVLLVMKIRGADVRWRTAAILGFITFVLQTLSSLNSLPADLFTYDTTVSFEGFLLEKVLGSIFSGLLAGAAILLIAAAAEPLYRHRFPQFLSLTGLVSPRAFRTKEFFISSMVGITLTCFFFAYENVFYIIANSLGAWAPREVAYSDLLSTAFPWVFVLFFGWFPAISEEFISRMFSIPFFEGLFRSRILAIVLAAFIWGFGHAEYPNQPFYIRGLEVGIAGIIFGLVLLRFGIAAVVICHFSVDALYTAFVLIRSHNPYYVVTGALAAGIFGILFLAAAVAYAVKGGFVAPELTNAADRSEHPLSPEQEAAAIPGVAGAPAVSSPWIDSIHHPQEEAEGVAAGGMEASPRGRVWYQPLSRGRILAGLTVAAGLFALSFVPVARYGEWADFATTRERAGESAATFLRGCAFDVSSYKRAEVPLDRTDELAAAYLLEQGGLEVVNETFRDRVPTPLWRVRFFIPGQHEEYAVSIEPRSGAAVSFERTLPEDAPGATLSKTEALAVAEMFVAARGQDPKAGELKEQSEKDEKARRDHTLVWEYPIERGGEAKVRYEVVVQGDVVGSWKRGVKIPEEWERGRTRETVLSILLRYLKIPFIGLLSGLAIVMLTMRIRAGAIPWRFAIGAGVVAAMAVPISALLNLDAVWLKYDTSVPRALYMIFMAVGIVVTAIFMCLAGALVGGLVGSVNSQARAMFSWAGRRSYARDALIAGLICLGFARGLPAFTWLLTWVIPSGRLIEGVGIPEGVGASIPFLFLIVRLVLRTLFLTTLGSIAIAVLLRYFKSGAARVLLAVLFVVTFLPSMARRPAELLFGVLSLIILAGGAGLLVRFFLRDNPLAWVWGAWFSLGCLAAHDLMTQSASFYRASGWIALVLVILPGLWLLKDAAAAQAGAAPAVER